MENHALIFWGTDWDELATAIGLYFQKYPPVGTKIIEYPGNKDWPGMHNIELRKKCPFVSDIPNKYFEEPYNHDEVKFYKYSIAPFIRSYIGLHKPYFSIELHSTLKKPLGSERNIEFYLSCCSQNDKSACFLYDSFIKKKNDWTMNFGHSFNLYHHFEIDIIHTDKFSFDDETLIKHATKEVDSFTQYMRREYPKLWKKYKS